MIGTPKTKIEKRIKEVQHELRELKLLRARETSLEADFRITEWERERNEELKRLQIALLKAKGPALGRQT